jgi:hypothetical protein
LTARLLTPVDSLTARRGVPVEAVLTRPLFSADQRLILPEGTRVTGEVTFSKPAGRFHRNGQLRLLFSSIQAPGAASDHLLATLYSVESGRQDRLVIDEEGGATATNTNVRFVAPALAGVAMAGTMHGRLDYDTDGAGPEMAYGGAGSGAVGGFIGAGALGLTLSLLSRPMTIAIGVAGLARSTYSSVFGKGREVAFARDTAIQLQLAPNSGAGKKKGCARRRSRSSPTRCWRRRQPERVRPSSTVTRASSSCMCPCTIGMGRW